MKMKHVKSTLKISEINPDMPAFRFRPFFAMIRNARSAQPDARSGPASRVTSARGKARLRGLPRLWEGHAGVTAGLETTNQKHPTK
jgi:hypothetical protein